MKKKNKKVAAKKSKPVVRKSAKKIKADELRRKAIRSGIKVDKFVEKWVEDGKSDPKLRNSQVMESECRKLEKASDKAYDEYYDYIHMNYSAKSIENSMNACIKNDKKRTNKGFMSKSFINRLK